MEVSYKGLFLVVFTMHRLRRRKKRGWYCFSGVEEVEGKTGEALTLGVILWKYFMVSV